MTLTLSWLAVAGLNLAFILTLIYVLMKQRLLTEPVLNLIAITRRLSFRNEPAQGQWGCVRVNYVPKLFAL